MQLKSITARLVVSAGVAYSYVWAFWLQGETVGSFTEVRDGTTNVTSATSPQAVLMGLVGLAVYCVLLNTPVGEQEFRVAPMWRRAAAFAVDFWLAVFSLGALFGFMDVSLEAARTGTFRWHFHRDYLVATDGVSLALVFVALATFVAYFLLPLMTRSQTVGCWIFRLATVNLDGYVVYLPFSTAMRRLFAEFRGVCSPLLDRRTKGRPMPDVDWIRKLCLSFPDATEDMPWGDDLCFKVRGKIFTGMVLSDGRFPRITLKCAPETFHELLEIEGISPAPYVGRRQVGNARQLQRVALRRTRNPDSPLLRPSRSESAKGKGHTQENAKQTQ